LPDALSGRVRSLDYKTLRFSGHYGWIQKQLIELKINKQNCSLTAKMQAVIPQIEEDQIVLYAAVEGKDIEGVLRRREVSSIYFLKSGNHQLRAIQTTTAAPLVQAAQYYLNNPTKEYFFKVRLIRKSFSTEIISYVCTAKQN
jgi:hypothetical protein